jgi:uncharacterized protein (DUF2384 family)
MGASSASSSGFNAAHWLTDWLEQPVATLDYAKPTERLDTIENIELISTLLAKMQFGAYALFQCGVLQPKY